MKKSKHEGFLNANEFMCMCGHPFKAHGEDTECLLSDDDGETVCECHKFVFSHK